jgi:hypothetical protein
MLLRPQDNETFQFIGTCSVRGLNDAIGCSTHYLNLGLLMFSASGQNCLPNFVPLIHKPTLCLMRILVLAES